MNPIILIQCRLKSKRLPYKALRPLYGKPMILHLCDRVEQTGLKYTVCTSTAPQDTILFDFLFSNDYPVSRGDPWNVAKRFREEAAEGNYNPIIRVTGDNPLTDPNIILDLLALWEPGTYVYPTGLPRGVRSEVIDVSLLDKIPLDKQEHEFSYPLMEMDCAIKKDYSCLMNTPMLDEGGYYREDITYSSLSMTCDTPEDYARLQRIYHYWKGQPPHLDEILKHWGKY